MGSVGGDWGWDGEDYSEIKEKGEIRYIDYEDDKSVCSYYTNEDDPVVISAPFSFVNGKPRSVVVGETATDTITLKNTTCEPVELWGATIFASNPDNTFTLSLMEPPSDCSEEALADYLESFSLEDRILQPGETLTIWLSCKPTDIGLHTTAVHFDVGDERIERVALLLVDNMISQSLASTKPYSKGRKKDKFVVGNYVTGGRPVQPARRPYRNRLPVYDIPKDTRELLENGKIPDVVHEGLTKKTYASFFKSLIIMEEMQLEEDMRSYDMECITMRKKGHHFLALEVPGLAERRPSLVHGDSIFAKLASQKADTNAPSFQGYVHRVEADEVYLKFSDDFHSHHRDGNRYNVHFTYNRINMRRLYQAMDAANNLEPSFLFPSQYSRRRLIKGTPVLPISENLNEEQMFSVEKILGCKGAPPYVIHGPPGTGKTMTVVEAILQLYTTNKGARILVCAASNSAADHVLDKILSENTVGLRENDIFRLNASARPYEDVRPEILRFCYFDEHVFKCPPIGALMHYRIVISTYMSASLLYAEGVKQGHFSHVFLDEAGQASEPETMISISNLCKRETVVVLAGDPMQLGPVIYSRIAESYGLGKSYLERLFECELYSSGDENYVTKLVKNYRCHPEILYLPSLLFYDGELIPCRDIKMDSDMTLDILPNKEFPVLFLGIQGCDEREGNNPSWFNRIEAGKVIEVVRKLTASGYFMEEDIGIITPYRQQVLKIKKALETLEMPEIKIGSVEQFQGQERRVIIVSTVRSTIKHNEFDKSHCLGFLSNERRFNVALTRAINLLIIIGNPHIICKDSNWNKLLWRCVDNSSYQGCSLPERGDSCTENDGDDLVQDARLSNEEPPWPSDNVEQVGNAAWETEVPEPVKDENDWEVGWRN